MDTTLHWSPNSLRIKEVEEQVFALRGSVICAFNQLLDLKDLNTGVHSTRLAEWGMRVGQELGLEEPLLANLEIAALLHDIGKVGIPDAILRKNGPLDEGERERMKMHVLFGACYFEGWLSDQTGAAVNSTDAAWLRESR